MVKHYFRPFFKTNLLLFYVLKTILALRSIANHFLGVFQRGDPPEPPPQILRPKNHRSPTMPQIPVFRKITQSTTLGTLDRRGNDTEVLRSPKQHLHACAKMGWERGYV